MEYFQDILKKNGMTSIFTSIVFAILGVILFCFADVAIKIVAYILGMIFIAFGVFKLINYWKTKGRYDFYNYDIAYGIIAILLGIIVMFYSVKIASLFRIIVGVWIVYSSIIRLNLAYKLKTMNVDIWKQCLVIALGILVCGLWVILTKNAFVKMLGVIVIIYSVLDAIEGVIFIKNIDKMF